MSIRRLIGSGAALAAAFVLWKNRVEAEPEAIIIPAVDYAPQSTGSKYAPLLEWGLNAFLNRKKTPQGGNSTQSAPIYASAPAGAYAGDASAFAPRANAQSAERFSVDGLLRFIGKYEAPEGYNQVYGGSVIQPPRLLTTMRISEVIDWQRRSVAAGSASSAAGKYQIIRRTLEGLVRNGSARSSDYFDAATQDRLARVLMEGRGLSRYQSGQISAEQFGNNLASEWASLPVLTGPNAGRSRYDGDGLNSALTTPQAFLAALTGSIT